MSAAARDRHARPAVVTRSCQSGSMPVAVPVTAVPSGSWARDLAADGARRPPGTPQATRSLRVPTVLAPPLVPAGDRRSTERRSGSRSVGAAPATSSEVAGSPVGGDGNSSARSSRSGRCRPRRPAGRRCGPAPLRRAYQAHLAPPMSRSLGHFREASTSARCCPLRPGPHRRATAAIPYPEGGVGGPPRVRHRPRRGATAR